MFLAYIVDKVALTTKSTKTLEITIKYINLYIYFFNTHENIDVVHVG